jgi:hypothetical protein
LGPDDPAARTGGGELREDPNRISCGLRVRVGDHDELALRLGDSAVDVGAEAERTLVLEQSSARQLQLERQVGYDDQLVDLRRQRLEAAPEVWMRPVRDDDP